MRIEIQYKHSKKTTAGESGSASCSPLPDPGTVNSDPPVASYMKSKNTYNEPHYVYSFTDLETLNIVYIGCTHDIYHRRRMHFSNSHGQSNVEFKKYILDCMANKRRPRMNIIGEYENYDKAHKVEIYLIKKLHPKFNIHHNLEGAI